MKFSLNGLYAIVDDSLTPSDGLIPLGVSLARAGACCVQLRVKNLSDREFLKIAIDLKCAISPTPLVINDRADICAISKAQGLHLGQSDLPPLDARKIVGSGVVIGLSCDNLEDIERANSEPIDYVALGPIFKTKTKTDAGVAVGVELLKEAVKLSRLPVVAIGGINAENVALIARSNAKAFAVISYLAKAKNPELTARRLIRIWEDAVHER